MAIHSLLGSASALLLASTAQAQSSSTPDPVPPAQAQSQLSDAQAGPAAANADPVAGSLEGDIVVTAQKRTENVQDVPLAVQVIGAEQLSASGAKEFTDLTKIAPSLLVRPSDQPVNASISIRGIGTFAFSIGVEPSVAVQVDDVPIGFQARAFADLSDIERIEVLRGPQSTLYGKSASAGLINIVTQAPTKTLTAKVNGSLTTDDEYQFGASIAGPIGDTLGFRISANRDDFNGNVRNLFTGRKRNGREVSSFKGKLVWQPFSALTVTGGLNYIEGNTTLGRPFIRGLGPTAILRGNPAQPPSVFAPGVVVSANNRAISNNSPAGSVYDGFGQSLKAEYDLGGPTLVSITAHDRYKLDDFQDQDETSAPTPTNVQGGRFKSDQWTQEVRLVSPGDQPLRYTLGLFYADVDFSRRFVRGPFYSIANWFATSGSKQAAAFGQLDWEFVPGTTATGGLRYQHERVDYTYRDFAAVGTPFFSGAAKDNFFTYKAGLRHEFTDDLMVYGSYATGHKGQTYDLTTGFNAQRASGGPVRPEKSRSYEIGTRTQFFDRRLTLNLTAFLAKYRDFQAQGIESFPDGTVNYRLANVGRIRTRGIELDSSLRAMDDLRLGASVAYLDAKITQFPFAQCYPGQTAGQGCNPAVAPLPAFQNLAGARPAQSPRWKLSANGDYTPSLGSLPVKGLLQAAFSYQSRINYSLSQDPETIQGGYGILNLAAGVRAEDGRYEVVAFVNNVTDKHYTTNLFNSRGTYNNQIATQALLPRDFARYAGVRVSLNY